MGNMSDGFIPNADLVSVIIPVYNTEKYLVDAVQSVLHQSYRNIEIILVDDGSPDHAPALCDELAEKYENIRVLHKENGGLSSARNAGTDIASGVFLLYLDSDDTLSEKAVEELVKVAVQNGSDAVFPDRYYQTEESTQKTELRYHFSDDCMLEDPVEFALYVILGKGRAARASALLYRASVIQENQITFPVGVISEDIFFNLSFLSKAKKISFLPYATLNYLKRAGSITRTFQPNYMQSLYKIDDCVQRFLADVQADDVLGEQKRASLLLRNSICYLLSIEKKRNHCTRSEQSDYFMCVVKDPRFQEALQKSDEVPYFQNPMIKYYFKLMYKLLRKEYYRAAEILTKAVANA